MDLTRFLALIALSVFVFLLGCSSKPILNPATTNVESDYNLASDCSRVIGSGTIEIDPETQTATVIPSREIAFHYNITGYLNGCPGGCFRVEILDTTDDIYEIEMTLENPTDIQVWDVRIFLFNIMGKEILNADGYSDYYTNVVFVPFINFYKEDPERAFPVGPGAEDTEMLYIDFSGDVNPGIDYLIEAGINEQFPEPVQIDPAETEGVFFSNNPLGGRVIACVHDHQHDPVVTLDATQIGLSMNEPMYDDGAHGDELADDGIFGSDLLIPTVDPGEYVLQIVGSDHPGWPTIKRPVEVKVYGIPEMVFIPAGEFQMGNGPSDPFHEDDRIADEKPLHTHPTDAYYIGKYELRVDEYAAFVENDGYFISEYWSEIGWLMREDYGLMEPLYWDDENFCGPDKQDHPMIGLSWYEAEAYCSWLSDVTGEAWRMPSEPEWERAARGDTDDRPYPWGNTWNDDYCNTTRDSIDTSRTSPVGLYSPNGDSPWGCVDMIGNACEWTSDWYQSDIYTQYEQGNFDPPASGSQRVSRGSCWWLRNQIYHRNSFRWNKSPLDFDDANGLRLLKEHVE